MSNEELAALIAQQIMQFPILHQAQIEQIILANLNEYTENPIQSN